MRSKWDIVAGARRAPRIGSARGAAVVVVAIVAALALTTGGSPSTDPSSVAVDSPAGGAADAGAPTPAVAGNGERVEIAAAPAGRGPAPEAAKPAANAGQPPTAAGEPPKGEDVPDEWIVQLHEGQPAEAVAAEHASEQDAEVREVYTAALDGYSAHMSDEEALAVAADPRVASVTRDRLFHATAQTTPPGIPRSSALGIDPVASSTTGDVNADIAVLDTGIDANHRDLNYRAGKNCISSSKAPVDDDGHGTHVAGTAAAKNDGNDVIGVAPGARVWSVKVLDSNGSGTTSQIVCGLNWVAQNAGTIEVATMSLGGGGSDSSCGGRDSMKNAICNLVNDAGIPVTVAAGNEGGNAANHVPAAYDEVITVSAYSDFDGKPGGQASGKCSEKDDTFAYFSNYGADVDITAPGVCVLSTRRGGGTQTMSGTSMATPHVAGAVAAYMAKNGKVSPAAVKAALQNAGTLDWTGDRDSTKEKALNLGIVGGTGLISGGSTPTTSTSTTSTSTTSTSTSTTSTSTTSTSTTTSSTTTTTAVGGSSPITVTLTKDTYDDGTKHKVKIKWTGATSNDVDVYRQGVRIKAATDNDGKHTDKLGVMLSPGSTRTYRVCHAGSATICSADVAITF